MIPGQDLLGLFFSTMPYTTYVKIYHALLRLLENGETGPIWIDALSINQEDIAERNDQVNQMAQKYEVAKKVIVWLGDEDAIIAVAVLNMRKKLDADLEQIIGHAQDGSLSGYLVKQTVDAHCSIYPDRDWRCRRLHGHVPMV